MIEFKTNYERRRFFGRGEMRAAGCFTAERIREAKRNGRARHRFHMALKRNRRSYLPSGSVLAKIADIGAAFDRLSHLLDITSHKCNCLACIPETLWPHAKSNIIRRYWYREI